MFSCGIKDTFLNRLHKILAVTREKLDRVFICFVASEKAVCLVVSGTVDRRIQYLIQAKRKAPREKERRTTR